MEKLDYENCTTCHKVLYGSILTLAAYGLYKLARKGYAYYLTYKND